MHAVRPQREVTPQADKPRRTLLGWFDPGEPHIARGPFTRWPRLTDGALAVFVFVGSLVAVAASALGDGENFTVAAMGDRRVGTLVMPAGAAGALLWRRRRPIVVAALVRAIMIGWALAGYRDGQDLALVVAVYSVGRYTADHRHSRCGGRRERPRHDHRHEPAHRHRTRRHPRSAPVVRAPPDPQPRRLPGATPRGCRSVGGRPARSGPSGRCGRTVPHRP